MLDCPLFFPPPVSISLQKTWFACNVCAWLQKSVLLPDCNRCYPLPVKPSELNRNGNAKKNNNDLVKGIWFLRHDSELFITEQCESDLFCWATFRNGRNTYTSLMLTEWLHVTSHPLSMLLLLLSHYSSVSSVLNKVKCGGLQHMETGSCKCNNE